MFKEKFKSLKYLPKLVIPLLLLLAIPASVYLALHPVKIHVPAANPGVNLSFLPSSGALPPNTSFSIQLNTLTNNISFARIVFTFNPAKVRLVSEITSSSLMSNVIQKTSMNDANASGSVTLVLATMPSQSVPTGTFELANFSLSAISALSGDSAALTFTNSDMQIVTDDSQTPTISTTNASISLNPLPTPAPTETATATQAPSATPTPRPANTPIPTSIPTTTPTLTPVPTSVPSPTPSSEVVNPANISTLAANTPVLLNFDNFPNPVDNQPIPSNFYGCTWNSLVEGSPFAGLNWNFYILNNGSRGTITFPRPVLVTSVQVVSSGTNTFTLSSTGNTNASVTTNGAPQTLTTNWTNPITTLTVQSSTSDQALDNLRLITK